MQNAPSLRRSCKNVSTAVPDCWLPPLEPPTVPALLVEPPTPVVIELTELVLSGTPAEPSGFEAVSPQPVSTAPAAHAHAFANISTLLCIRALRRLPADFVSPPVPSLPSPARTARERVA